MTTTGLLVGGINESNVYNACEQYEEACSKWEVYEAVRMADVDEEMRVMMEVIDGQSAEVKDQVDTENNEAHEGSTKQGEEHVDKGMDNVQGETMDWSDTTRLLFYLWLCITFLYPLPVHESTSRTFQYPPNHT